MRVTQAICLLALAGLGLGFPTDKSVGVPSAHAANIAAFSQTSATNTLTATVNAADTQTTLTITDAPVSFGQFIGGIPPASDLSLSAHSIDAAATLGGAVIQHYAGSFSILAGPIDVLSGTFSDAAFGALSGPGLVVNVNSPPDTLILSSALVPAGELAAPNALSLAFTNLTPELAIAGTTIAPFTASFAGTVSSSRAVVTEPAGAAALVIGLIGLGVVRRRPRRE